jgi:hypothetical protein
MNAKTITACFMVALLAGCSSVSTGPTQPAKAPSKEWQNDFGLSERNLVPTGQNPFFILEPGFQLSYESDDEKLVITVLDETVMIDETKACVVEEREWKNGQLVEVSRNFFAICPETKDVFYFGEEVDDYENGKITGHDGAWRADQPGNRPGLIMPGNPAIGMKYYLEMAPRVAMDRAEVISLTEGLTTPAGRFENCLKTREGSALKPMESEIKIYAPGIGLLKDGDMLLTEHGFTKKK